MRPVIRHERKTVALRQQFSAAMLLLACCTVAIAADDQHHANHIPEPVVIDIAMDLDGNSELLVMPQLHYELSGYLEIQVGADAEYSSDDTDFSAGFRFIYSR